MMRRLAFLMLLLVLLGAPATVLAAEKNAAYAIKIHRPMKAGDTFAEVRTVASARSITVTVGGEMVNQSIEDKEITLEADYVVDTVNDKGRPTKQTVTVRRFEDDKGAVLLPRGTVLTIDRSGKATTYTPREGTVSEEAQKSLNEFFRPIRDARVTDDNTFGTPEPRKVGDTWPVNAEAAAADASAHDMVIKPEDVTGQVTLKAVEKHGGVDCLRVEARINARNIKVNKMPEGTKLASAELSGTMHSLLPVDVTRPVPESSMSAKIDLVMTGTANDRPMRVTVSGTTRHTEKTLAPPAASPEKAK